MGYVVAALAVAGTAASVYASSQAAKGSGQNMATPGQVLQDSGSYVKAQQKLDASQAQLALQYYPQFAQAQLQAQGQSLQQALNYYPQFAQAEQTATSNSRAGDLSDFQNNSGGWAQQLGAVAPAYAQLGNEAANGGPYTPLLNQLNGEAATAGPSDLSNALGNSAMYQLSLGGSITPQEQRDSDQASNAAWSSRGLINSTGAVASQLLNRDALSNSRLQQRQGFAGQVQGLQQSELSANRGFQTGVQGANEAAQGNWRNFLVSASQAQVNPIMQGGMQRTDVSPYGVFGGGSNTASPYGMSQIFQTAPQISNYTPGITNLYADQLGMQESRANNAASSYAAIGSGLTSMAGSAYKSGGYGGMY